MRILIPIGGADTAFKDAGYPFPKSLIELKGKPLIQHVYENLQPIQAEKFIFVIRKEEATRFHFADVLRLLAPNCDVVVAENATSGAACTALLAIERINLAEELVIANGDQIFTEDLGRIVGEFRRRDLDAATVVFDSVHPRWSYVRVTKDGFVVEASEKRPISRMATAGIYYFKRGEDFCTAAMEMIRKAADVNGAYYICPTFNEMILRHARIGVHPIAGEHYFSLATPQGVERYERHMNQLPERSSHAQGTA